MKTGRTAAASEPKMPPLDCITSSFARTPASASLPSIPCR